MRILCFLGFHKWNMVTVIKHTMAPGFIFYTDSKVCMRCKKHKVPVKDIVKNIKNGDYEILAV